MFFILHILLFCKNIPVIIKAISFFEGERSYETHYFNDNVERILVDDHNVPNLWYVF